MKLYTILDLPIVLSAKKEFKSLKKQVIQGILIKMNKTKLVFNMTWSMKILRTYLEYQLLKNY